jgi:hypothetical protein
MSESIVSICCALGLEVCAGFCLDLASVRQYLVKHQGIEHLMV